MPRFLTKKLVFGYGLVSVILIANAVVFLMSLHSRTVAGKWVTHTQEVMLHIRTVENLLTDAETGQRGFLLTGDERYLQTYKDASGRVAAEIGALHNLVKDNPAQLRRLQELDAASQTKLSELALTVNLARHGNMMAARAVVETNIGHNAMQQVRAVLRDMIEAETRLLDERQRTWEATGLHFIATIIFATTMSVALLVLVGRGAYKRYLEQDRHAELLDNEREWLKIVLTSIGDCVIATDANGRVTFLNPVAEATLKRTQASVAGQPLAEVFPISHEYSGEPIVCPVDRVIETGNTVLLANHTVVQCGDGSLIPIEDSAAPIKDRSGNLRGVVLVFRDVSAAKKTQAALRQTEKLAAAGRLAASIAHEINNPLEAVSNLLYLMSVEDLPDSARAHLEMAQSELERVAHMTKQTLGFYRDPSVPSRVDVGKVIDSVLNLYGGRLRARSISVVRDVEEGCEIFGPEGEFRQVISNLTSNALDAMRTGGQLTVRCHTENSDGKPVVRISVEDTGTGIPADVLPHIFEPFYTTKQDVGTGLGLWVAHSLVEKSGGSLHVHTCVDNGSSGTRFEISLPIATEAVATNASCS